jgi:hypothetical protein
MTKSNCYESFNDGKAERVTYPLRQGRYKLEEQERNLLGIKETIRMVRDFVRGRSSCTLLGSCVADDKHLWLKRVPLNVAHLLGYNLLPGLIALKKEGAQFVDRDYPIIERDCLQLLDRLEQVRVAIKNDISIEYDHMKRGDSMLDPLIDEAIRLVRRALVVR